MALLITIALIIACIFGIVALITNDARWTAGAAILGFGILALSRLI